MLDWWKPWSSRLKWWRNIQQQRHLSWNLSLVFSLSTVFCTQREHFHWRHHCLVIISINSHREEKKLQDLYYETVLTGLPADSHSPNDSQFFSQRLYSKKGFFSTWFLQTRQRLMTPVNTISRRFPSFKKRFSSLWRRFNGVSFFVDTNGRSNPLRVFAQRDRSSFIINRPGRQSCLLLDRQSQSGFPLIFAGNPTNLEESLTLFLSITLNWIRRQQQQF